jgi:hypothetical protein
MRRIFSGWGLPVVNTAGPTLRYLNGITKLYRVGFKPHPV